MAVAEVVAEEVAASWPRVGQVWLACQGCLEVEAGGLWVGQAGVGCHWPGRREEVGVAAVAAAAAAVAVAVVAAQETWQRLLLPERVGVGEGRGVALVGEGCHCPCQVLGVEVAWEVEEAAGCSWARMGLKQKEGLRDAATDKKHCASGCPRRWSGAIQDEGACRQ